MKAVKFCFIKLIICLSILSYCLYSSENSLNFDTIALTVLSCRYFAILCIEVIYARLDRTNPLLT
ncbi:hypothetical protein [Candidatus Uabimicrobium sp. HlEnr_7]|uniref:hypothetical protein n=1 Tax=Candidatus Uabimicrobium helgolandensis TaxID=3095367 RepID=UPI0035590BC5